ncbi:DNA internalization-related competence protein ComEC/Rec2 [Candidatus Neomarinimicrobiota bacterium]
MVMGNSVSWPWHIWCILVVGGLVLAQRWEGMLLLSIMALGGWWAPSIDNESQFSSEMLAQSRVIESVIREADYDEERVQLTLGFIRTTPDSLPAARGLWRIYSLATLPAGAEEMLWPGDTLVVRCTLELPARQRNPNGFDYRHYLWTRDIQVLLDEPVAVLEVRPHRGFHPPRTLTVARQRIAAQIEAWLGRPQSGLATGLLLGDKRGIDDELRGKINALGIGHILAVSGLHVGYVALVLLFLAQLLRMPRQANVLVVGIGLLGYILLTGAPASVVRASIMAVLFTWGQSLERRASGWNLLGAAAIISLLINPKGLYTVSFQLSFSAVAGILYIYPLLRAAVQRTAAGEWIYSHRASRYTVDLFLVGLGAQMGVLPVILLVFHAVSIWVLAANLIVVPLAGLALICLILALLVWGVWSALAAIVAQAAWLFITLIQLSVEGFTRLPWLQFATGRPEPWELVILICCMLGFPLLFRPGHPRRRVRLLVFILVIANVLVWKSAMARRELEITFLDVGQGDAVHLAFPDGRQMLLDAGMWTPQFDYGERVVFPYLRSKGIRRLDGAIISHPQGDHMGGLLFILDHMPVDELWDTPNKHMSVLYSRLRDRAASLSMPIRRLKAGQVISEGGVGLYVLSPDSAQLSTGNVNDGSLVLKLVYGATSVLFMGDAESTVEERLLAYGDFLHADWLKVGHHGSATGTTAAMLEKCRPQGALISVGRNNIYKHPSEEVNVRLEKICPQIYRTDMDGALVLMSDGRNWKTTDWRR